MDGDNQQVRDVLVDAIQAGSSLSRKASIAGAFSSLATPVVAEAVQRAHELATGCDAEGFHQLRVALRKLRALYWAYLPYLGEETTTQAASFGALYHQRWRVRGTAKCVHRSRHEHRAASAHVRPDGRA